MKRVVRSSLPPVPDYMKNKMQLVVKAAKTALESNHGGCVIADIPDHIHGTLNINWYESAIAARCREDGRIIASAVIHFNRMGGEGMASDKWVEEFGTNLADKIESVSSVFCNKGPAYDRYISGKQDTNR